ncbi:MAG: lipocalin family protein [Chitinophagaceae bacterium]
MTKTIIAFSLFALSFSSCSKSSEENKTVVVSNESIAGTYSFGSVTYKAAGSAEQDYPMYTNCQKDDKITLGANGAFLYSDEGEKCDPAGEKTGTWSLSNNNTVITLDGSELNLLSFNGSVLKVGDTDTDVRTGTSITITITLNKQ